MAIIQHITSPLTSALCIFGVYKTSHIPKIRAWLKAMWIISQSTGVKPHHVPKKASPFTHPHHRSYHTSAAAAAGVRASTLLRTQSKVLGSAGASSSLALLGGAASFKARGVGLVGAVGGMIRKAGLSTSSAGAAAAARMGLVGPMAMTAMPAVGAKHLLGTSAVGVQQRRTLAGHAAVTGNVLQEAMKNTYLFPSHWYVPSPYTGQDIVWTSEFMQNLLQCKPVFSPPFPAPSFPLSIHLSCHLSSSSSPSPSLFSCHLAST